jgi:ribonuclease T2
MSIQDATVQKELVLKKSILTGLLLGVALSSLTFAAPASSFEGPSPTPSITPSTTSSPMPELIRPQLRSKPKLKPKLQPDAQTAKNVPGQFDFYVLALSWSPDYCATKGDPQQCGSGRQLGFVLHGLWPQYEQGWPASCSAERFDPKMQKQFPDLYPSTKLYTHEWEKHGTCSGLTQPKFHQLASDLKASVALPAAYSKPTKPLRTTVAELKQAFVKANPGMTEAAVAPTCSGSGRFLQEVMVCLSKDGKPRDCSAEVLKSSAKSCAQPDFLVRSVR